MTVETFLIWVLLIVGGYLLGSVMFCRLVCLIFYKTDICKVSKDGNPGAANAFRYCGKWAGALGLFCDLLKGFLPVFVALKFLDCNNILFVLTMFAPVLGHAFSVFQGFAGGKCIATIYGELAALLVTWTAPALILVLGATNLFFEFFVKSVGGNKRAFIMFSLLILVTIPVCIVTDQVMTMVGVILISLLAILKHSSLYAQAENKPKRTRKTGR